MAHVLHRCPRTLPQELGLNDGLYSRNLITAGEADPACLRCEGILKTRIVYFGENLPLDATTRAWDMADQADAVLVVGSSLCVYPAAFVPLDVVDRGNPMVIVNLGKTDHDIRATALVDGSAGDVVPELVDRLIRE